MNKKQIAMRIRQLREERNLTQKDVADVLGIHQPAYCAKERGDTSFTAVDLDKLAVFYNLSLDELLRADQPVLNMYENKVANGYNVIHTQNQQGISAELFNRLCDIMENNAIVLKDIAAQHAKLIELLARAGKS
ncbi:MAG: helix-turn-helix transcriptional regulator [Flavobacteriales bacterium]|nr:helix-turn-helix transcriptional regulator [Flavobacteriales bacterium]